MRAAAAAAIAVCAALSVAAVAAALAVPVAAAAEGVLVVTSELPARAAWSVAFDGVMATLGRAAPGWAAPSWAAPGWAAPGWAAPGWAGSTGAEPWTTVCGLEVVLKSAAAAAGSTSCPAVVGAVATGGKVPSAGAALAAPVAGGLALC